MSKKECHYAELSTSDQPLDAVPLSEYPRPQLKRNSYLCLNGRWDFETGTSPEIPSSFSMKIMVPFPVESALSNIHKRYPEGTYYFYRKRFRLNDDFVKDIVLLHLDGVDQEYSLYLNNQLVGNHAGGYLPAEYDITLLLREENTIVLVCKDDLNHDYPYGKQRKDNGGMWYTPVSGIWKSVWIESVKENYFRSLKMTTTLNTLSLDIDTKAKHKKIIVHTENKDIIKEFEGNQLLLIIENPVHWTPDNPFLYTFELISEDDHVESYFALRTFDIQQYNNHSYFFLNNVPFFVHGLLDQGYFPDGIFTPRSYEEYEKDILTMKQCGFNTLRKHIKIEPLYFYYLCDKLGILLIQDMVQNGEYHYVKETVLPTIGYKKFKDTSPRLKSKKADEEFLSQTKGSIELLYNVPSIVMWCIFNEGWGQHNSEKALDFVKKLDSKRVIDLTSGWFDQGCNPVNSEHFYFKKIRVKDKKRLTYVSEFGGYNYRIKGHSFNLDNDYGYKGFEDEVTYQNGLEKLYEEQVIPLISKGLAGTIYTQVSDVEDETNGLITYDRKVLKVNPERMKKIAEKLKI